jgi:hypothetical protein
MKGMMQHKGGQEIVREDHYKGHHIVVRTKYNIAVDGRAVTGHIMLTNAGDVQYHGLPNYSFDSTVELTRALIDNFPEDFEKKTPASGSQKGMHMRGALSASTSEKRIAGRGTSSTANLPSRKSKRQ